VIILNVEVGTHREQPERKRAQEHVEEVVADRLNRRDKKKKTRTKHRAMGKRRGIQHQDAKSGSKGRNPQPSVNQKKNRHLKGQPAIDQKTRDREKKHLMTFELPETQKKTGSVWQGREPSGSKGTGDQDRTRQGIGLDRRCLITPYGLKNRLLTPTRGFFHELKPTTTQKRQNDTNAGRDERGTQTTYSGGEKRPA